MNCITVHEFDALVAHLDGVACNAGLPSVPPEVFAWLEAQALRITETGGTPWLRLAQRGGQRAMQVTSFVGVIRAPGGYQIEVLPKIGKMIGDDNIQARQLLIDMLRCLGPFRHIQTNSAQLLATRMPLLEVFIAEFLQTVQHLVKRGIRSNYATQQDNLFTLRGKLQVAAHLRHNLCRHDRFFTEFDEFIPNRPENRLLHLALRRVLAWTAAQANQQLARELCFAFADVPLSQQVTEDFQQVRLDRSMAHYDHALAWAQLILQEESPLTGTGTHGAASLLFPMEVLFEAFVAKHLARQLGAGFTLHMQMHSLSLVRHREQEWFRLKPDLLLRKGAENRVVMDTKWKLIDSRKNSASEKYGLGQGDFYQLYAYGQNYLNGTGDMVLIYPKTDALSEALPVFEFQKPSALRLWVLPFCLRNKRLLFPSDTVFDFFKLERNTDSALVA